MANLLIKRLNVFYFFFKKRKTYRVVFSIGKKKWFFKQGTVSNFKWLCKQKTTTTTNQQPQIEVQA